VESVNLKQMIREIHDFPKPGINFYDVTTLFRDAAAFRTAVDAMARELDGGKVDAVLGIEARGFILGAALAYKLNVGLIVARKFGKLPAETEDETYQLEYGEATIEVHRDAISPGERVLVIDDLLATGGTAAAAGKLVEKLEGVVAGYGFLVELDSLGGREKLGGANTFSLLHYP
jgi:adenine phosphoribosyltransferase